MCERDVDECIFSPCEHRGTCINTLGGFTCQCPQGWLGDKCSQDLDECVAGNVDCQNGGTCVNTPGNYWCSCVNGWQGHHCEHDVDECSGFNSCHNGGLCENSDGGFTCLCLHSWSGPRCEFDVNECLDSPGVCGRNGTCENVPGSYLCHCDPGFTGGLCDQDIDECARVPDVCARPGNFTFVPAADSKHNVPASGYRSANFATDQARKDVGHSADTPGRLVCVNTVPGYICICQEGLAGVTCDNKIEPTLEVPGESEISTNISVQPLAQSETMNGTGIDGDSNENSGSKLKTLTIASTITTGSASLESGTITTVKSTTSGREHAGTHSRHSNVTAPTVNAINSYTSSESSTDPVQGIITSPDLMNRTSLTPDELKPDVILGDKDSRQFLSINETADDSERNIVDGEPHSQTNTSKGRDNENSGESAKSGGSNAIDKAVSSATIDGSSGTSANSTLKIIRNPHTNTTSNVTSNLVSNTTSNVMRKATESTITRKATNTGSIWTGKQVDSGLDLAIRSTTTGVTDNTGKESRNIVTDDKGEKSTPGKLLQATTQVC